MNAGYAFEWHVKRCVHSTGEQNPAAEIDSFTRPGSTVSRDIVYAESPVAGHRAPQTATCP